MRLVLLTVLLALLPAPAFASLQGKYLQNGSLANHLKDDPIVNPGQPGQADHWHSECGAVNWDANATTGGMLSGATTMTVPGNKSAYWTSDWRAPDGTLVAATSCGGYYRASFAHPDMLAGGKIYPYPQGIRLIVGNSKSTVLQSANVVSFRCSQAGQPALSSPPKTCPAGVGLTVQFFGPACWNGRDLDSTDHRSHVTYAKVQPNGVTDCDPSQIRVPSLEWEFRFPPAAVGGCPDSDHGIPPCGRSAHMDLWEAQDAMQQAILTQCLNDPAHQDPGGPVSCGTLTSSSSPFLVPLIGWTNKLDYIAKADGSLAQGPA